MTPWNPQLAPFICPECGGGFSQPQSLDTGARGVRDACPWCSHPANWPLEVPA